MQGEVLSPVLFDLFIKDFKMNFFVKGCTPYECKYLTLFLLLYTNDLLLYSYSLMLMIWCCFLKLLTDFQILDLYFIIRINS